MRRLRFPHNSLFLSLAGSGSPVTAAAAVRCTLDHNLAVVQRTLDAGKVAVEVPRLDLHGLLPRIRGKSSCMSSGAIDENEIDDDSTEDEASA